MVLGFGEQRVIAVITGMWVTAFALVAIWTDWATVSAGLLGLLVGITIFAFIWLNWAMRWKILSAYTLGTLIVLLVASAFRLGLF